MNAPRQRTAADRRRQTDRRTGGERRRNAEQRTPIIHVTPDALRVLIMVDRPGDQSMVGICRTMPWRIDAASLHTPQGAKELAAAMAKLSSEERLAGTGVEVLLSGELCVTRAVTGAADDVHREASALRERSQLYLSLGPGKKVIASSSTPLDARHAHALLTVATEQTLQVLHRAVESSGMELVAIRSAQVCLARAVDAGCRGAGGAVLAIGVDNDRVELGVMRDGRLFLDYRPGGDARVGHLVALLRQHHTRLERYCQRHHGLEGDGLSRVVVSGAADEASRAASNLAKLRHLEVEILQLDQLTLPWEHRGDQLTPDMAAVVGAALMVGSEAADRGPNLMDQLTSKARPPIGKLLSRKLAPLAAALVVGGVFGALNWNACREVAAMQAQLAQLAPRAARASNLQLELIAGLSEIEQLGALKQQLAAPPYALLLRSLTQSVPGNVWLSGVHFSGDETATLAGASYAESSIYDMVGHLQHLPGVAQVALQGTGVSRKANRNATTFDIHLDLDLKPTAGDPEGAL